MIRYIFFGFAFLLAVSLGADGAINYKTALHKKNNFFITDGVVTGGEPGKAFSLISVRRFRSKRTKVERIVLDIGDERGKPSLNKVNYFHAHLDKKNRKLTIDLSQVQKSGVNQKKLDLVFKKSPYVKTADISYDPIDNTTIMVLYFRKFMAMEVFELPSNDRPSRIVMDVRPAQESVVRSN